jgi:hypothetical protein
LPDADGQLSTTAVMRIVRPIMLAADVPVGQAHPHALRRTFGRLYMAASKAALSRLQRIMGARFAGDDKSLRPPRQSRVRGRVSPDRRLQRDPSPSP